MNIDSVFAIAIVSCFGVGAVAAFAGVGYRVVSDRSARSPATLQAIETREDHDELYVPDEWLLSDRGRILRRRGTRLIKLGILGIGASLAVLAASIIYHSVVAVRL